MFPNDPSERRSQPHPLDEKFDAYGLGWFSFDYQGRKIDEHTGLAVNRSSIAVVPEENLGVAMCTNACFSTPDVWRDMRMTGALKLKVIDRFIDAPETDWSSIFWDIHEKEIAKQWTSNQS